MEQSGLRSLPSIDNLLGAPELAQIPGPIRALAARAVVHRLRKQALDGQSLDVSTVVRQVEEMAEELMAASLRPAINMTGVILHTGLGRARLGDFVSFPTYANLEIDVESGERSDRQVHVRNLLQQLTGAEDAFVVNNCAAAVVLALRALCGGREVVLSRGQMVEIGGSFRMPDIVGESGCTLVEVGCTNKTRLGDYADATNERTAGYLRCHTSNFVVKGFTGEPKPTELAALAREKRVVFIDDCGSGCLLDTTRYGLPRERTIQDALNDGADIVTASGDKLLGGPQAGLILGKASLIKTIAAHPLARALRIDKLSLGVLENTLRHYLAGKENQVPTWRYVGRPLEEVKEMATLLNKAWPKKTFLADGTTEIGGGSLPGCTVPTIRVGIKTDSANNLAKRLRKAAVPVFGRIENQTVWLDPRTCEQEEVEEVADLLRIWRLESEK